MSHDFLTRLAAAEQRDLNGITQQILAANALDDMLLDGVLANEDGQSSLSVIVPTLKEVERLIEMVWGNPAAKRNRLHASSTNVDGTFDASAVSEVDLDTWERLMRLIQNPAGGRTAEAQGSAHSAAQQAGWSALFRSIDANRSGVLTKPELMRYIERQRRVLTAERNEREQSISFKVGLDKVSTTDQASFIERDLREGMQDQILQTRATEAAMHTVQEAIDRESATACLFALVAVAGPPAFRCVEARLFVCRDTAQKERASLHGGAHTQQLYTYPPEGQALVTAAADRLPDGASHASGHTGGRRGKRRKQRQQQQQQQQQQIHQQEPPASWLGDDVLAQLRAMEVVLELDEFSIPGAAASTGEEQNVADVWRDARFDTENRGAGTLKKAELKSTLCVPIFAPEQEGSRARRRCLGCLQLINKVPRGVAWDADRTTYTPEPFRMRDTAGARALCAKLGEAIQLSVRREARQGRNERALAVSPRSHALSSSLDA